jgi:hypothetical protein
VTRLAWLAPLFLLLVACGSGSDAKSPPELAPPPVDPRLTVRGDGRIDLNIPAGGVQTIDPLALAEQLGIKAPPCATFVFLFSWQVDSSQELKFTGTLQGATVITGKDGNASTGGCMSLDVRNPGDRPVTGELRYVLADAAGNVA